MKEDLPASARVASSASSKAACPPHEILPSESHMLETVDRFVMRHDEICVRDSPANAPSGVHNANQAAMSNSSLVTSLRIMHTCLNVMDLDRSIAFYRDRLGLKLTRRVEIKENNAEIAFLEDPEGSAIELTHWRDKKHLVEGDNFDHVALGVEGLKATIERLRAEGTAIAMQPFRLRGGSHEIAFIKDPDGNWLELIEE